MKTKNQVWTQPLFAWVCLSWLCLAKDATGQPVLLAIQRSNTQATVFWPGGLGWVQPQRATNFTGGVWQDFGAATTATNLVGIAADGQAFYRLRFLAPSIVAQPRGLTGAIGGKISFEVAATGTAPLLYQWRRNGTNLAGQTTASLALNNVAAGEVGEYTVVISNRVGAATSAVVVLTLTNLSGPNVSPRGVYLGNFAGQTNGGLAALVSSNGLAFVIGQSVVQTEGVLATNLPLAVDGSFNATGQKGGKLSGAFAGGLANGTLITTNATTNTFTATRKPDSGIHQANAGFYAGTFGGLLSGNAHFVLAADGAAFVFISSPVLGSGGAYGSIDASNSLVATANYTIPGTTVPALILITGSLNPATHQFAGAYSISGITLGTFAITRTTTP